jgi:hypothetical protein
VVRRMGLVPEVGSCGDCGKTFIVPPDGLKNAKDADANWIRPSPMWKREASHYVGNKIKQQGENSERIRAMIRGSLRPTLSCPHLAQFDGRDCY